MANKIPTLLRSVREVVDALGGTKATAVAAGVLPSAVSNWLAFNCIPPKRYLVFVGALKPLGHEPSPAIFREHRPHALPTKSHEAASV